MAEQAFAVVGAEKVKRGMEQLEKFFKSTKPMDLLTEDVRKRIETLTARSVDYRGRRFAPYSPKYAEFKKKKTGSSKVDLRLSGKMMDSLSRETLGPRRGRVFIKPESYGRITTEGIAEIHSQGTGPHKQREFMNVTKNKLREFIKKRYDDPIGNIVRKYFRGAAAGG